MQISFLSKRIPDTPAQDGKLDFQPSSFARHSLVQTVLSVRKPSSVDWIRHAEHPILLDAGRDVTRYSTGKPVRLLAYYLPARPDYIERKRGQRRGLVLMLHGWQGCSHSTYNLVTTDALVKAGYDVVRLNMRDHGPGIHLSPQLLNTGPFLGTLIEEAIVATQRIAELAGEHPFFIVGPSMGGNFALRLAAAHATHPFPNLQHVLAISPAINPASATDALDAKPLYLHYFRRKWMESIRAKIHFFPKHFAFLRRLEQYDTIRLMTEWVIPRISAYRSADEYFHHYAVRAEMVSKIQVPTSIITAKDDQVIPVKDFEEFPLNPALQIHILDYGGHVGFIDLFPMRHCLPSMILRVLEQSGSEQTL